MLFATKMLEFAELKPVFGQLNIDISRFIIYIYVCAWKIVHLMHKDCCFSDLIHCLECLSLAAGEISYDKNKIQGINGILTN